MRQRPARWIPLIGIGLSAVLLFWLAPSGSKSRRAGSELPPPVRKNYVSPTVARLQEVYRALPKATRVGLALGIPFDDLPAGFSDAIREVLVEQFSAQQEEVRSNLAIGRISRGEYEDERAYMEFVPKHLSRYLISTNGDNYAMILFRTPIPGRDVPKQDRRGEPRGICRVR